MSDFAEIRRDPIRGHWTIIAPGRGSRPVLTQTVTTESAEDNPFQAGNESETPKERFAVRDESGNWTVRVVPNRYPALHENAPAPNPTDTQPDPFVSIPARGQHEVIVECPHFEQQLAVLTESQITDVLIAWQSRLRTVEEEATFDYGLIFKNSGKAAGASIPHSHSQLTATVDAPTPIQAELTLAREFYEARGVALQDYVVERECQADRSIWHTDRLVAFCPYASRFGSETWIAPVGQPTAFNSLDTNGLTDVAVLLKATLLAILEEHPNAAYNLHLHTAPFSCSAQPWFRWRLEICPRLAGLAGFELATGCYINTLAPGQEARKLRERLNIRP
jgi:UDPglucose--hexose-1-phosphate uridylyltransferase